MVVLFTRVRVFQVLFTMGIMALSGVIGIVISWRRVKVLTESSNRRDVPGKSLAFCLDLIESEHLIVEVGMVVGHRRVVLRRRRSRGRLAIIISRLIGLKGGIVWVMLISSIVDSLAGMCTRHWLFFLWGWFLRVKVAWL